MNETKRRVMPVEEFDRDLAESWCADESLTAMTEVDSLVKQFARVRADERARVADFVRDAKIDADGLDIPTWGEGVGEGIGSCRQAILDFLAESEATR